MRASGWFCSKIDLGSFSHGVSFGSKQAGETGAGQNLLDIHLDVELAIYLAQSPFRP
jgi:hypothetical protein